jgi:hypothetical protein
LYETKLEVFARKKRPSLFCDEEEEKVLTHCHQMALSNNCHELTTLECAGVSQFTDTGFQALARCHHHKTCSLRRCNGGPK